MDDKRPDETWQQFEDRVLDQAPRSSIHPDEYESMDEAEFKFVHGRPPKYEVELKAHHAEMLRLNPEWAKYEEERKREALGPVASWDRFWAVKVSRYHRKVRQLRPQGPPFRWGDAPKEEFDEDMQPWARSFRLEHGRPAKDLEELEAYRKEFRSSMMRYFRRHPPDLVSQWEESFQLWHGRPPKDLEELDHYVLTKHPRFQPPYWRQKWDPEYQMDRRLDPYRMNPNDSDSMARRRKYYSRERDPEDTPEEEPEE